MDVAFETSTLSSYGLDGSVFTKQDVMSIIDNVKADVSSIMQEELEHTYHTAGLMLKQVNINLI